MYLVRIKGDFPKQPYSPFPVQFKDKIKRDSVEKRWFDQHPASNDSAFPIVRGLSSCSTLVWFQTSHFYFSLS